MKGFALSILLLLPLLTQADVYRWVDENGQTHFGDRPPAETSARSVGVERHQPTVDPSARERKRKMDEFLERQQQERDKNNELRAEQEAKEAKQAERCRAMHARLKHMESVSVFYRLNDEGERVFYSDEDGDRMRQNYQRKYQQQCLD